MHGWASAVYFPVSPSQTRPPLPQVDRGSWTWVREDQLNFLMAGLSDLAPLSTKYTLNELRLRRDATEENMKEVRTRAKATQRRHRGEHGGGKGQSSHLRRDATEENMEKVRTRAEAALGRHE